MPGLYSIQAVSSDLGVPDITMFHKEADACVQWMKSSGLRGKGYDGFLLRTSDAVWESYDIHGKHIRRSSNVTRCAK